MSDSDGGVIIMVQDDPVGHEDPDPDQSVLAEQRGTSQVRSDANRMGAELLIGKCCFVDGCVDDTRSQRRSAPIPEGPRLMWAYRS